MKRFLIVISVLVLIGISGFFGARQYKAWRESRLVERAKASLEKHEYRDASLFARQAVQSNPDSLAAIHLLADLAELGRSTNALFWRSRLVELAPTNLEHRLMFARTALVFGQPQLALDTLDAAPAALKQNADYFKIRGNSFWSLGRAVEAEESFSSAARLDPTNATVHANLNLVRLLSTNSQTAAEARASLLQVTTDPATRMDVLRQLCADAIRRTNVVEALGYSTELVKQEVLVSDRLRHLALLFDGRREDFSAQLQSLQERCATNAVHASVLARWMNEVSLTNQSSAWVGTLPDAVREQVPVLEAQAEQLLARGDWDALEKLLAAKEWGPQEYLRQLLAARVNHARSNSAGKRGHWLKSLKEASGRLDRLIHLARVTEVWAWRDEMDDTLNAIVNEFPNEKWAEKYLSASLHLGGKTQALQNLLAKTVEREPTNHVAKSNLATIGLLLKPEDDRWHDLAGEAFRAEPSHPFIAATHALSLHLRGQTAAGLAVLANFPADHLEQPSVAVWYGFLLAQSGQTDQAAKYVKLGEKARLLPEESKLLATIK